MAASARLSRLSAITAGLGAGLLFSVELLFARLLLPHLGGSAAVWTTCLFFFQALLLGGYGLGHLAQRLRPRDQVGATLILVGLGALLLPPSIPAAWSPDPSYLLPGVLALLTERIGLPFLALASMTPLLLGWLASRAERPERLLAASNAGSLLGLLAYPLLLEPALGLWRQGQLWSFGYVAWGLLVLASGLAALRAGDEQAAAEPGSAAGGRFREWALLAALPSALLYGVTTAITTFLPPLPLLWVLPLALYLAGFVLAFRDPRRDRAKLRALLAVLVPLLIVGWLLRGALARWPAGLLGLLALHLLGFGALALALHQELARRAPSAPDATRFNLAIGVGGLLGGALCALAAPLLLRDASDYPLLLALGLLTLPPRGEALRSGRARLLGLSLLVPLLAVALDPASALGALPLLAIGGALALALARQRAWSRARLALALGLVVALGLARLGPPDVAATRSLHGVHRVVESEGFRHYLLGGVVHGRQRLDAPDEPLAYFARSAPLGQALASWSERNPQGRVSVVGLGVGGLLPYARSGQRWRFYELDPTVERFARAHFRYLERSPAAVDVVLGDGRRGLQSAARAGAEPCDLLVLDAFNGDAVPVHLLTEEACALYLTRLSRDGLLLANVSTRFLRLAPLLARHARRFGLVGVLRRERFTPQERAAARREGRAPSTCVALSRDPAALAPLRARGWEPLPPPAARTWTDQRASVLDLAGLVTLEGK